MPDAVRREAGVPATPAAWGVEARVEDFDTSPDGLLQLRVRGARRFQVRRTRVRDNGLLVAEVGWREPDGDDELRPEHALLGTVLGHAGASRTDDVRVPARRFDEAGWVGWRLADLLPLGASQRLALLQEDDVHARLDRLLGWMG
jgi:Lon protease-like protein